MLFVSVYSSMFTFEDDFQISQLDRLKTDGPMESHILGAIPFNEGTRENLPRATPLRPRQRICKRTIATKKPRH